MKILVSLLSIALILSSSVFAVGASPTLTNNPEKSVAFETKIEGSTFELTLDENPSTGYGWVYVLSNEDQLKLISDESVSAKTDVLGASSKRVFTFEVKKEGVYTILFEYKRSFDKEEAIEVLDVLVYKTEDKLIVEENKVLSIMDGVVTGDISRDIIIDNKTLDLDVSTQVIDGIVMVPLALPLRALGYEVTWHPETESVEIQKGAQWTSITLNKNGYFINKMAVRALSGSPVISEGRTLVPVEFFNEILGLNMRVENYNLIFDDQLQNKYIGKVLDISYDETGGSQITISVGTHETSDSFLNEKAILNVNPAFTYVQGDIKKGHMITAYTSFATTMSIPPQTSAYLIYMNPQGLK